MLLLEEAAATSYEPAIQVFGSDLDTRALTIAREGRYPAAIESRRDRGPTAAVLHARRRNLSRAPGAARYRAVRRARPAEGSAVLARRPDLLPQCADLSRSRTAGTGLHHVSLCAQAGRIPDARNVRERRQSGGLFRLLDRSARIYQSTTVPATSRACCRACSGQCARASMSAARRAAQSYRGVERSDMHRRALEKVAPASILVDETHRVVHCRRQPAASCNLRAGRSAATSWIWCGRSCASSCAPRCIVRSSRTSDPEPAVCRCDSTASASRARACAGPGDGDNAAQRNAS